MSQNSASGRESYGSKLATVVVAMVLVLGMASVGFGAPLVVTPVSMDGWTFYTTDNTGSLASPGTGVGQMVNGPATPPLGTGSAQFAPGAGDESVQLRNVDWAGTKLADLTSLDYSTYATAWNGQQVPWLNLYLDSDGNGSYDDRLWFEPAYSGAAFGRPQPDPALNTWQSWDALNGYWYSDSGNPSSNGPGSNAILFSAYVAAFPDAVIVNPSPGVGGIRFVSGFASFGDSFDAYVDAFTIGTAAATTTYDFELQGAEVPEPTSLLMLGTGLVLAAHRVRRRVK